MSQGPNFMKYANINITSTRADHTSPAQPPPEVLLTHPAPQGHLAAVVDERPGGGPGDPVVKVAHPELQQPRLAHLGEAPPPPDLFLEGRLVRRLWVVAHDEWGITWQMGGMQTACSKRRDSIPTRLNHKQMCA